MIVSVSPGELAWALRLSAKSIRILILPSFCPSALLGLPGRCGYLLKVFVF